MKHVVQNNELNRKLYPEMRQIKHFSKYLFSIEALINLNDPNSSVIARENGKMVLFFEMPDRVTIHLFPNYGSYSLDLFKKEGVKFV